MYAWISFSSWFYLAEYLEYCLNMCYRHNIALAPLSSFHLLLPPKKFDRHGWSSTNVLILFTMHIKCSPKYTQVIVCCLSDNGKMTSTSMLQRKHSGIFILKRLSCLILKGIGVFVFKIIKKLFLKSVLKKLYLEYS